MNEVAAAVFGPTLVQTPLLDYCVLVVLVDRRPPRLRYCAMNAVRCALQTPHVPVPIWT